MPRCIANCLGHNSVLSFESFVCDRTLDPFFWGTARGLRSTGNRRATLDVWVQLGLGEAAGQGSLGLAKANLARRVSQEQSSVYHQMTVRTEET
jgi:hypothetical protein